MGRFVYISAPNHSSDYIIGSNISVSEYFQSLSETVRECLYNNGIDSYVASSSIKDESGRCVDALEIFANIYLQIGLEEDSIVRYISDNPESKALGKHFSKNLSKIWRKIKYPSQPVAFTRPYSIDDMPMIYVAFRNETTSDRTYLIDNQVEIASQIAKSICEYYGIKWNYRVHKFNKNEFRVVIPPVNNRIKANTIAYKLKTDSKVNAKVI